MRLSLPTHRLATVAVIAGGAIGALASAGPAAATVPGTNGTIVSTKCEDGGSCKVGHLWTVDPATGNEHQLTNDGHYDDDPSISPDGSRVAYRRCNDYTATACTIAVVGIGGGTPTELTSGALVDYPAFSPDGSKIAFSEQDGAGNWHLFLMDASGANQQPLTSGTVDDQEPAWSPDGSSIAFSRFVSGSERIYKLSLGGGSPVPLSAGPHDWSPTFSPDGSHVAFARDTKIQIIDSNGTDDHTLTDAGPGYLLQGPVFSPDGTKIAFARYADAPPNPTPLMVMDVDGSNVHPITSTSEALYRPDWQATHPAPPVSPPPAPASSPTLTLAAPRKESVRKGRVYLFATSSKTVAGAARGKISVSKLAKSYRLRPVSKTLAANTRTKITLRVPAKTLRAARTALAHHERAKATVVVRVKDSAGNVTSKRLSIRLMK